MRRIIACFLLSLFAATSCKMNLEISDFAFSMDKCIAKIIRYTLADNKYLTVVFNESVELVEYKISDTITSTAIIGSVFTITLPNEIEMGESISVSIKAKKENGNTTKASLLLIGRNKRIPPVLINEVSTKGTQASPDRIELAILGEGNVAGMVLSNGLDSSTYKYILPNLEVNNGDLIVIYWNTPAAKEDYSRQFGRMTYFLGAKSPDTLISTNGVIILKNEIDGTIADSIVYSNYASDDFYGYGNEKTEKGAKFLQETGEWYGYGINASSVTSSRVLARLPDNIDTNTAEDWFITNSRKSTFGEENVFDPYIE